MRLPPPLERTSILHSPCAYVLWCASQAWAFDACVITMQRGAHPLPRRRGAAGSSSTAGTADPRLFTPTSSPSLRRGPNDSPPPAPNSRSHHDSFDEGEPVEPSSGCPRLHRRRASSVAEVLGRRKKKAPLDDPCWWCWSAQPDHHPDDCHEKLNLRAPAPAVCVAPAVASDSRQWGHGAPR